MSVKVVRLVVVPLLSLLLGCSQTGTDIDSAAAGPPPGFRDQAPYLAGATVGEQYTYWLGHSPVCGPAPALLDGVLWQVTNGTAPRSGFTSPWQLGELTVESEDTATFVAARTTVGLRRTAFTDYLDVPGGNCA